MPFASVTLSSWNEIHSYACPGKVYRGQSRAEYGLRTSLERCCDRNGIPGERRREVEDELGREFRRAYHQYAGYVPEPAARLEWLSLMQHYGAPTRLLDFTYSIYIACYFAVEAAESDAAVWSVDSVWALKESVSVLKAAGKGDDESIAALLGQFVEKTEVLVSDLFFAPPTTLMACPINPFRLNERLRIQKGIFIAPGSVEAPFAENLAALPEHDNPDHVLRITIPQSMIREALAQLFQMNITRTALFPGLDGYSRALGVYHPIFDQVGMLWKAVVR